ncbi:MAG TPA: threonine--tRNA ligase [bacterium]|nr:threonine--tRNA ligase [bacterium]
MAERTSVDQITLRLPDGSARAFARGVALAEAARETGARDVLAARVDGEVRDLAFRVDRDAVVEWLTFADPAGREVYWHSTSHLLAQAVRELFPGAKLAIGPPIDDGFYYDFDIGRPFTPEDLERIEAGMRELAARDQRIERIAVSRGDAVRLFRDRQDVYKSELLEGISDDPVSFYRQNGFQDMCRGPHLPSTGLIKAVKLLSTSGAYWRGDERRTMLQRIYGISFPTQQALDEYLARLEEAKRRDHRKLGRELGLFASVQEVGQGLPLWLPRGATVRRILERYIIDLEESLGYLHVHTPDLANVELYKISGHWDHYRENMYPPMKVDTEELVLRPMNCPHHIMVFKQGRHSYRDLPVRIAELGTMYRYERSGVLTGLARVRAMTLNDAHIFCRPDQLMEEFISVVRLIQRVYADLGLHPFWYRLSTRDPRDREKFVQNDAMWESAEGQLRAAMQALGLDYVEAPGDAAFYGPKLDVQVPNVMGKDETISTVQLDFYLPERFGLEYIGEDSQPHRPVMIHRGVISTLERMMAFLIEQYAGAFPLWLAPEQVRVLPIADRHLAYARRVADALRGKGIRVEVDASSERTGHKIREAQLMKIPYMLVVGDREEAQNAVAVRSRTKGDEGTQPLTAFAERVSAEAAHRQPVVS